MRRRWIGVSLVLISILLVACTGRSKPTPAPTSVPLPTKDFETLMQEAEVDLENQQFQAAEGKLQQALILDDSSVKAHFMLGNAYAQQSKFA